MKRLWTLAWTFFSISAVTLGGGMAMLPVMQREFVDKQGWLTEAEMVDIIAVMHSLPGLIAVNMAVLIGYRVSGIAGSAIAAFAAVLAPFVTIVLVATGFAQLSDTPAIAHAFLGVRAAVSALILLSVVKLAKGVLKGWFARGLAAIGFLACVLFGVDVAIVVGLGLLIGVIIAVRNLITAKRAGAR